MNLQALANERVSILHVCKLIDVQASYGMKLYCPFGRMYHRDDGVSPSFRIYEDTNSGNCFAGCGYFSPVTLYARSKGLEFMDAADELLDSIGYDRHDVDKRWDKIMNHVPEIDVEALGQALRIYCSRIDRHWEFNQFETPVSTKLGACLQLLDHVSDLAQAQLWLKSCKLVMERALSEYHSV